MKHYFPDPRNTYRYLQTNRSDVLGNLWSTFNLDFQSNVGAIRLANKLVMNTTSSDDAALGRPGAFAHWYTKWWAICGSSIFQTSDELLTGGFTKFTNPKGFTIGLADSQFDVTNPSGTTFRYTYDGTGTDPGITSLTVPIGTTVIISAGSGFASGNEGTFTVTGSGSNYFEVTNASGVVESDKTITTNGYISVSSGTYTTGIHPDISDLKVFNGRLWLSTQYGLYSLSFDNGNSPWVLRAIFASDQNHKLAFSQANQRLYFKSSSRLIGSIDTSDTVANSAGADYAVSLDGNATSTKVVMTIEAVGNKVYIGTQVRNADTINGNGITGSFIDWDGVSQTYNEYKMDAGSCLAIVERGNTAYVVDSHGIILRFSGYALEEIARLPVNKVLLTGATTTPDYSAGTPTYGYFIHYNGIVSTRNNTLLLAVNNLNDDNDNSINENLPSGIWELELATGNLTHKHSFTLNTKGSATTTDYGQNRIYGIGAIALNYIGTNSSLGRSTILTGATVYTDATTTKSAIFINSPMNPATDYEGQKRGYFVTTWFQSSEITSTWVKLWAVYKKLLNGTDKLAFKYRLNDATPLQATITWTSTTTFTTSTDISAYSGYEVEIIQGTGSGTCAVISNVSENAGTYTATIETAITGVTGTAKARFQKWIALGSISNTVLSYGELPIAQNDTRIQIKGIFEWTGDNEFHKMILTSTEDIDIE